MINTMTSVLKPGNNGTVSCTNFCLNQTGNWGPTYAGCVGASRIDNNQSVQCSDVVNTPVNCFCSNNPATSPPPTPTPVSTIGPLYTEVVFYIVSKEDTDVHWESYYDSRSDRACPTLACRDGFQEYEGRCYDKQYLDGGWSISTPGFAKRSCPEGSSCVAGFCTYYRPAGEIPGTTCRDDSLRNDGTSCWKDCKNREATSDRPCDSLRDPIYAAQTCTGSKKTSIGTWIAVTRELSLSCPNDGKEYNRVGRTCYQQDCGKIVKAADKRCNSDNKRLENKDSICYEIPRAGFDCGGTTTCTGATCSKSIASVDRYTTDAACQDNMYDSARSNCRENDYYCRNEYYAIESNNCHCSSGNAGCGRDTARKCAIFDINRLTGMFPAGLIKQWRRINRDPREDTNKLYRITLDLTKLVASNIETVYDNLKKYFITDQGFTTNSFFDIRFVVGRVEYMQNNKVDYKQYRLFPKKYNDTTLEMIRMYIFYKFPLPSLSINKFLPSLTNVLVFFIVTMTTPYNEDTTITKTDTKPEKVKSYCSYIDPLVIKVVRCDGAWVITNQNYQSVAPVFGSNGKIVNPITSAWQLSLSLEETSNPNGAMTNISFVRHLDTSDWPEDFVNTSQAVYAGFLNLHDNLISLGNNNYKALMAFKQNFITRQAEYGLPESYLNWNEDVYYNVILPKISTVQIADEQTYCPDQSNYFLKDPSTKTRKCLFMTSTYCKYNNIESGQCDVNRYCMTAAGLREKQQPANTQRSKTILDEAMIRTCSSLCTSAKLDGFCPMECQCLMRDQTPFMKSNSGNVDLMGNAGCWFAPCQIANESKYYVPNNLQNPSCPQTVCQNIVDIYKVQGNVAIKNISFDNQCAPYVPTPTPLPSTTAAPITTTTPSVPATPVSPTRTPYAPVAISTQNPFVSTSTSTPSASATRNPLVSTMVPPAFPTQNPLTITTPFPYSSIVPDIAPESSARKIGIIIAIVLAVLLVIGGGGAFLYLRKKNPTPQPSPSALP